MSPDGIREQQSKHTTSRALIGEIVTEITMNDIEKIYELRIALLQLMPFAEAHASYLEGIAEELPMARKLEGEAQEAVAFARASIMAS